MKTKQVGKHVFGLRGIHESRALSEETPAFSATVVVDGKAVGDVGNHGTGGPCDWGIPMPLFTELEEEAKKSTGDEFEALDGIVYALLDEEAEARMLNRAAAKKVLFRLKGDEAGSWRTCGKAGVKMTDEARTAIMGHLRVKYGETIESFYSKEA